MVIQKIPKEDRWDYGLVSGALLGLSMTKKHGCKKFPLKIGLEVGTDVLLILKANVGDYLYMIVCLHDHRAVHRSSLRLSSVH